MSQSITIDRPNPKSVVDFSNLTPCKQLEALKASLFNLHDTLHEVDHKRVEYIKEELSAGRYNIDSLAIANKLLE